MTTTAIDDEVGTGTARSVLYTFLAGALAFPTDERLARQRDLGGPLLATITTGDDDVDTLLAEAVDAFAADPAELRRAHTAAFPPIDSGDHPPYESAYASSDIFVQTDVMADVAAFHRAHGLRAGGSEPSRPDHICAELGFMGFMARKEVVALQRLGPDEVAECRRTQAAFLRDHLGCWGPAFGRRLALLGLDEPYRAVGRLLRAWIELDLAALQVAPAHPVDEPQPPPPPDDGTCGWDGAVVGAGPVEPATPVGLPVVRKGATP